MPFTSDKRLYLDAEGNVVEEGNAAAVSLLVGEGGQLDDETAKKYGLTGKSKAETKAVDAPAETKAVSKAPANK